MPRRSYARSLLGPLNSVEYIYAPTPMPEWRGTRSKQFRCTHTDCIWRFTCGKLSKECLNCRAEKAVED